MEEFKKYNQFLIKESKDEFYKFILSDINIYVYVIIDALKKQFNMNCWYLYHSDNSVSLQYYQSSDDSYTNILEMKKFLFDKLPYFRDLACYEDDHRLVLKFIEVGDPVKFKFQY
jgi:hypothetical protein